MLDLHPNSRSSRQTFVSENNNHVRWPRTSQKWWLRKRQVILPRVVEAVDSFDYSFEGSRPVRYFADRTLNYSLEFDYEYSKTHQTLGLNSLFGSNTTFGTNGSMFDDSSGSDSSEDSESLFSFKKEYRILQLDPPAVKHEKKSATEDDL